MDPTRWNFYDKPSLEQPPTFFSLNLVTGWRTISGMGSLRKWKGRAQRKVKRGNDKTALHLLSVTPCSGDLKHIWNFWWLCSWYFRQQWFLNGGGRNGADMNVKPAWARGYTGDKIRDHFKVWGWVEIKLWAIIVRNILTLWLCRKRGGGVNPGRRYAGQL